MPPKLRRVFIETLSDDSNLTVIVNDDRHVRRVVPVKEVKTESELEATLFSGYYRPLNRGETIKEGDEYLVRTQGEVDWKLITLESRFGQVYDPRIHLPCRRPLRLQDLVSVLLTLSEPQVETSLE